MIHFPTFSSLLLFSLGLVLFTSCNEDCGNGECPVGQAQVVLDFRDAEQNKCLEQNSNFLAIALSSNEAYEKEIVLSRYGSLFIELFEDIEEYTIKINDSLNYTLQLDLTIKEVECCRQSIRIFDSYILTHKESQTVVCEDCNHFEIGLPTCGG